MDEELRYRVRQMVEEIKRQEEISVSRPLYWGFNAGLWSFALTVAWTVLRNGVGWVVLERGLLALVVFSVSGYILGRFIERAPKVILDPKRLESTRPFEVFSVDDLEPGMILSHHAISDEGDVLVPRDLPLTKDLIDILREYGVETVKVSPLSDNGEGGDAADAATAAEERGVGSQSMETSQGRN